MAISIFQINSIPLYIINNLTKYYDKTQQAVLHDVSLEIPQGRIFGLLGPNGAGKTTLISIILGLISKTSGSVLFKQKELECNLSEARQVIGYVPQELAYYPMLSAHENLQFYAAAFGLAKNKIAAQIEFCVETTGLQKFYYKKSQTYSGGLKRRLNLAIGLLNQPELLCLDEPTVGIDPQSRNFILETIQNLNQHGMTVIYTSHYMEEVQQICHDVAIIDRGKILIHGKIEDLLHQQDDHFLNIQFSADLTENDRQFLQKRLAETQPNDQTKLEIGQRSIKVSTHEPLTVISKLTPDIQNSGLIIERLDYGNKNLEELFLEITRKDLRDSSHE